MKWPTTAETQLHEILCTSHRIVLPTQLKISAGLAVKLTPNITGLSEKNVPIQKLQFSDVFCCFTCDVYSDIKLI